MDELFTKYERELVILRSLCREYAQRYPKVAAKLQMGGDTCDDPHVERLIQSVALLSARVAKRLDDSYPQFTEALLNLLFPHYLRPFPSCAIARVVGEPSAEGKPKAIPEMPRGTLLESTPLDGVRCTFKTTYEICPSAVVLAEASFETLICAPVATRLPDDVASSLTLRFESAQPGQALAPATATVIRVYSDGDSSFCAALRDALFVHTKAAYLQLDDDGPWERLPVVPITPVGFAADEALIPFDARSHTAYRILAEYFSFPEKFNFFDIDIPTLLGRMPAGRTHFTLRLAIADIRPDGDKARMLAALSKQHILQGCTPVVNLFRQPGVPITYNQLSADYTLLASGDSPQAYEVYSVDKVHMVHQRGRDAAVIEFRPFYSLKHGEEDGTERGRYWLMRHDETRAREIDRARQRRLPAARRREQHPVHRPELYEPRPAMLAQDRCARGRLVHSRSHEHRRNSPVAQANPPGPAGKRTCHALAPCLALGAQPPFAGFGRWGRPARNADPLRLGALACLAPTDRGHCRPRSE
jgi:type VI secretion system protein ImpG